MKLTTRILHSLYGLGILFTIVLLLGCGNSDNSKPPNRSATITFQLKFSPPNQSSEAPAEHSIKEADICIDYLIDTIAVQVYRTQDNTEVAAAEENCITHSLTVKSVPAGENLYVVCKGYVGGRTIWQGQVDNIIANAGQNTDIGAIALNYTGHDMSAPEIASTFPAADAEDVDLNASIAIVFNEALSPGSIPNQAITLLSGDDSPVPGQVHYDPSSYSIRFIPANALDSESTYTATLQIREDDNGAITDTAGHPFADDDVIWQFTTRGANDTALPQVIATSPANDAIGVAPQASISVLFSEPMDPDSLNNSVFQLSSDQGMVSGQIAYDNQDRTMFMTPDSALEPSTLYTAVINTEARDPAQNALSAQHSWQFWTSGPLYDLTVTNTGSGSGTIVATPAYIDCGNTCQTELMAGTTITLEAIAENTSEFTGWSGYFCNGETGPCTFTMTNDVTITANFKSHIHYTIGTWVFPEDGCGGFISPTSATVIHAGSQTFHVNVNPYFHLAELMVDSIQVPLAPSYTFENVTANHTIQAIIESNAVNISEGQSVLRISSFQKNEAGHLVWYGRQNANSDYEIYYFDGINTRNISNNSDMEDLFPQINVNGHVVWCARADENSDYEIYYFDVNGSSPPEIISTNPNGDDKSPRINADGQVVWYGRADENSDYEIYYFNVNGSSPPEIISTNPNGDDIIPRINANGQVVWYGRADENSDYEIYRYNGSTQNISNDSAIDDRLPQINAVGHVVWYGRIDENSEYDVYYFDGENKKNIAFNPDGNTASFAGKVSKAPPSGAPPSGGDGAMPPLRINADGHVAWRGIDDDYDEKIFYFNGSTTINISNHLVGNHSPQINASGHVVWCGCSSYDSNPDIYYYDGKGSINISINPSIDSSPQISANGHVVWASRTDTDSEYEIFYFDGSNFQNISCNPGNSDRSPQINADKSVVWIRNGNMYLTKP